MSVIQTAVVSIVASRTDGRAEWKIKPSFYIATDRKTVGLLGWSFTPTFTVVYWNQQCCLLETTDLERMDYEKKKFQSKSGLMVAWKLRTF